jgi:hypothetical protein
MPAQQQQNVSIPSATKSLGMKDISERAKEELRSLTDFPVSSVVSMERKGDAWTIRIELLEKSGIPDRMDILGIYDVQVALNGDVLGYTRKGLRKRGDTGGVEEEEE